MAQTSQNSAADIAHKPMMSTAQILLMNVGFFGIQYSFGMQQNAMSPIYQFLGASADEIPILNLAGPVTGLLIQPLIGALSDRTWSEKWGRRKPFFLIGAVGCSVFLFLMPFVTAVWMAVLCLWLLDASNNTAMEPYRAFIGTGQMVDFLETERIDYQMALEDARRTGNKKLVDKLEEQGPPPYESRIALKTNAYLSPLYGTSARTGQLRGATFSTMEGPYGVEYGLLDKVSFFWGLYRTFDSFYGRLYPIDLRQSAAEQQIPAPIFHGRYDYNAPTSLVEDYYARLRAPRKSLVYFEHSGHNPWQTENELFIDHVRRALAESA